VNTTSTGASGSGVEGRRLFEYEDVPSHYYKLTREELHERGRIAKEKLGDDLLVLAHHYQQDDTFWFADVAGDSLYLAQQASKTSAKYIVFCGVHFMAESADILTRDDQIAILPSLAAGCSMADMADPDTVEDCWDVLTEICGEESIIPITYINSSALLKAFCALHGGTVCTSSNSEKILKWALDQGKRVLFFPDQHLGRNTGNLLGVAAAEMVLWDRNKDDGGLSNQQIKDSKIILWDGFCSVHCRFTAAQVESARLRDPKVKVIVHPECPEEVVQAADFSGSTNKIMDVIKAAEPGSSWAVGTEINMVNRLAREMKERDNKKVEILNPNVCICSTMYRVHPANVLWILESLVDGTVHNQISVPKETADLARQALDRMLELSK